MFRYKHFLMPVGLALMALATRYLYSHDTGTVCGAFILGADGLKWLVVQVNGILAVLGVPEPKPMAVPGQPYPRDPFLSLPLDAMALGVITAAVASIYVDGLHVLWKHRKRPPSLTPFEEI